MIQNNPAEESFIRRKFLSTSNTSFQKRSADLQYDSADEVDVSEFRRQLSKRHQSGSIFSRFWLTLVTFFSSIKESSKSIFRSSNKRYVYTPIRKQNKGEVHWDCWSLYFTQCAPFFRNLPTSIRVRQKALALRLQQDLHHRVHDPVSRHLDSLYTLREPRPESEATPLLAAPVDSPAPAAAYR